MRKPRANKALVSMPEKLSTYLAQMKSDERALLEAVLQRAVLDVQEIEVIDLWEQGDISVSYWVLLMSGVNQEEEMAIANVLLSWQAFFSKQSARVICIQSSDRDQFRCCSYSFAVVNCPTLILSDSPAMDDFVKIESELLFKLLSQKGGLQRFLTKIHSSIENGDSISTIQSLLTTEKFWFALRVVYTEIKGFVSFSAKKDL